MVSEKNLRKKFIRSGHSFFCFWRVGLSLTFKFIKNSIPKFEASAVAASYGSVSAVTFVTAMQFLENNGMSFGGHMTVALVRMEFFDMLCDSRG